jgi:predicted RNA-binding Zn-ribbon protein involved in translation (DUF1610 family)
MKTTIPILRRHWHNLLDRKVKGGALTARTDKDYLVWPCPDCQVGLPRGTGVNMLDSNANLNIDDGPPPAVTVKFHCPECGCHYDFKMPLDRGEQLETGGGLEG